MLPLCRLRRPAFITVLLAAALSGCGRGSYELETAPASGQVNLDGEPLPQGIVYVLPSKGRSAKGMIQPDGSFVLSTYEQGDGAQVGTHPAVVAALPKDELDQEQRQLRMPIPKRYSRASTSGLTVEILPGEDNVIEWDLTSDQQ